MQAVICVSHAIWTCKGSQVPLYRAPDIAWGTYHVGNLPKAGVDALRRTTSLLDFSNTMRLHRAVDSYGHKL